MKEKINNPCSRKKHVKGGVLTLVAHCTPAQSYDPTLFSMQRGRLLALTLRLPTVQEMYLSNKPPHVITKLFTQFVPMLSQKEPIKFNKSRSANTKRWEISFIWQCRWVRWALWNRRPWTWCSWPVAALILSYVNPFWPTLCHFPLRPPRLPALEAQLTSGTFQEFTFSIVG